MSVPVQPTRGMGDPQTRRIGDPQQTREMSDQQPTRRIGDPQQTREMSDQQPTRRMGDPQPTRGMADSQQTRVSSDPQSRGSGNSQQTSALRDPQQTRATGDPQKRGVADPKQTRTETDRKSRVMSDPHFQGFGDPQIRALGDPVLAVARVVGRVLLLLLPVYIVGRLGLSVTWLLFGLFLWTFWNRNKKSKMARLRAAWELLDNESLQVTRGLNGQQLPAWVNFPDVDRVEWINKVVKQMWPYFGIYMEKLFQEKIEPLVRASNDHLKAFTFTKVHFGEKSPRINGVKAYTKKVDKREVILDLQLCYAGDCEINVEVKKLCKAGVKGIQIHGTLRLILGPLLPDVPFIGAVTFFFIQKPFLDINWTGLTNLLEIPGVSDMSDGMIVDLIASYLVLPNRFTFPLSSQVNAAELRFPVPHGVLRAYLYEAENLIPKDTYLKGLIKGKSDPYAILRVGNQTFKSKTIRENLNPLWNEMYEFVVHEVPGQDLEIDVYDEDPDKDDFLGSLVIGLEGVMKDRIVDEWFPLSDVVSGSVHLKLEWHSLLASQDKLCEVRNGMSTAMLIVYLDSASGLPVIAKGRKSPFSEVLRGKSRRTKNHFEYSSNEFTGRGQRYMAYPMSDKEPTSYVIMTVGKKTVKSKTCSNTKDPTWDQAFSFFIQDVHMQHLHLEVKDNDRQCALGMLDLPLHRVLSMDGLTADQRFPLTNSGPNSFIRMKIVLRVSRAQTYLSLSSIDCCGSGLLFGEINISVRYASLRRCLLISINGCRNLLQCSNHGADPYVRIYLLPDRRWASRKKTTIKRKTVHPIYNERFEFLVSLEDAKRRMLDIAVKNNRPFGSQERKEMGKILVDLSQVDVDQGITDWFELTASGRSTS
ncbi:extended synaptotagmin-3 [Mantella aurantiaca]